MAIITFYTLCKSSEEKTHKQSSANDEDHKTAQCIGKYMTAIIVIAGLITLYVLASIGIGGIGPLGHLSFGANLALLVIPGSIELITILGLALKACGWGGPKQQLQVIADQKNEQKA